MCACLHAYMYVCIYECKYVHVYTCVYISGAGEMAQKLSTLTVLPYNLSSVSSTLMRQLTTIWISSSCRPNTSCSLQVYLYMGAKHTHM